MQVLVGRGQASDKRMDLTGLSFRKHFLGKTLSMAGIGLFDLLSQRNQWLAQRQLAVSQNVANSNTPGYRTVEVKPFQSVLQSESLGLARSSPNHMAPAEVLASPTVDTGDENDPATASGNNVSLEQEMLKAGDIAGQFSLNTSVYKSFHKMILNCAR